MLGVDGRTRNFYVLEGQTGRCLATSDPSGDLTASYSNNLLSALNGKEGFQSDPSASYMDVAFPIQRGGESYVIYIQDNRQTAAALNSAIIDLVIRALFFGLVISILLSFLLSKTMIIPIERLTEGAERVAEGDFSHKLQVASRDEIGILTGTFNAMARQLQETLDEVENERNKLDTLFLHMTDGVVAFSESGAVIHANPAAERMLGRPVPVGGEEGPGYDELFGNIAPLSRVLDLEPPDYLEGTAAAWSCCWPPSPGISRAACWW